MTFFISHQRRPSSLVNISVYAFGLTGLWTAVSLVILQFKILEIVGDEHKATWVGIISIVGLAITAVIQPIVGGISDGSRFRLGRRLPFIVVGSLGLLLSTVLLGLVNTLGTLIVVFVTMQIFGNIAQSAGNGLLLDHVGNNRRGAASGALNLSRAAGAGIVTMLVLFLLTNYDPIQKREWMWAALFTMSGIVFVTTVWTFFALKPKEYDPTINIDQDETELGTSNNSVPSFGTPLFRRNFMWFLIALTLGLGTVSTVGRFALFFLKDAVGLENPAAGGQWLAVGVGVAVAVTVYPVGVLSDRIGRLPVLFGAGIIGAASSLGLAFNQNYVFVLIDGIIFGIAAGTFLSVAWALATDLVPKNQAAKMLGYTSVAHLLGGIFPLSAGFLLDGLNSKKDNLGYQVLFVCIAAISLIIPLILTRIRIPTQPKIRK